MTNITVCEKCELSVRHWTYGIAEHAYCAYHYVESVLPNASVNITFYTRSHPGDIIGTLVVVSESVPVARGTEDGQTIMSEAWILESFKNGVAVL